MPSAEAGSSVPRAQRVACRQGPRALEPCQLGLDYLVPIGGDDTLSFSQVLADKGVKLIAVPKTMDNDVQGTEYCIGFSTAISRAKDAINRTEALLFSADHSRHLLHLQPSFPCGRNSRLSMPRYPFR
jgi:6-phosphofructokinase